MIRGARDEVEVVVTGLGVVGPFGTGRDALLSGLAAGVPSLVEVDRSAGYHRASGARFVSPVAGDFGALLPPGASRRMSPPARLAVAAAKLALVDAGLDALADHTATGIVTATAYGPTWVTERLLEQIFRQGPEAASPALFTESVANAAAAQMALVLKARGPNVTITQREASDLIALGEGARWIRGGLAERVLVTAVEDQVPILHALLDRFGALAHAEAGVSERPRPFDRRRNGLLLAEGSVALLLESATSAAARGASPLARLLGTGASFDPTAPAWDWGTGVVTLADGLTRAATRAGVDLEAIDLVVSGASGSVRGDRLEALVLRRVFERAGMPPVIAPKGTTGEYGGGAVAAAILAAAGARFGSGSGFEIEDPELGIRPAVEPPSAAPRLVLASALAAGGAAAWALLAAPENPAATGGV